MANHIIGIDVGTGSVRGGLVDVNGNIVKTSVAPIKTWNPRTDFYQQSSEDIWRACCLVVQVGTCEAQLHLKLSAEDLMIQFLS